jgi:hypothetical protein
LAVSVVIVGATLLTVAVDDAVDVRPVGSVTVRVTTNVPLSA